LVARGRVNLQNIGAMCARRSLPTTTERSQNAPSVCLIVLPFRIYTRTK
jgi:hypothetical protein